MVYDLEGRTANFSAEIIKFCYSIQLDPRNRPLISQLIRSGTSIGANYREANQASSKKDFANKIRISQKEASETEYWLGLISLLPGINTETCRKLKKEAHEMVLIFGKITASCKNSPKS